MPSPCMARQDADRSSTGSTYSFWDSFCAIFENRIFSLLLIGSIAWIGCWAVGKTNGIPIPWTHDEHSYLFAADTFAHGHLTNPTHPMWEHFETFHIAQQPTTMSKYPPAQGICLAIGKVLWGHPIYGVWLSYALMCSAICWMLQGWMSPRWAILGGLLVIFHPRIGIGDYFAQSYWGGAVATFGGALVYGGLRRIVENPNARDSLLTGFGILVLANSRPFEGLVVTAFAFVSVWIWTFARKQNKFSKSIFRKVLLPLIVLGSFGLAAMGYYNNRITGEVFKLPYQVYENAYSKVPLFVWQKLRPDIAFRHKEFADYEQNYSLARYNKARSLGFLGRLEARTKEMRDFMVPRGNIFVYPLGVSSILCLTGDGEMLYDLFILILLSVGVFSCLRGNCWMRVACLSGCTYFVCASFTSSFLPHYAAPILCLFPLICTEGARTLMRCFSPCADKSNFGRRILSDGWKTFFILMCCAGWPIFFSEGHSLYFPTVSTWTLDLDRVTHCLDRTDGKHLVIVRYGRHHSIHLEFVYNEADLSDAKVIWAREMDEPQNQKLLRYFKDRKAWLLERDDDRAPPRLIPYGLKQPATEPNHGKASSA